MFQLAQPAFETTVKEAPESADRHANLADYTRSRGARPKRFAKVNARLN
jgi:hypothetical protein